MARWRLAIFLCSLSIASVAHSSDRRCASAIDLVQPLRGVIADEKTAAAVALAYLTPIYGANVIGRQLPLRATLNGGVWTVEGVRPRRWIGGSAYILMCQRNGTVLRIIHTK